MLIGEDFNTRTGEKGRLYDEEEEGRISRDKKSNKEHAESSRR